MMEFESAVRAVGNNLKRAIVSSVTLYQQQNKVHIRIVTDEPYTERQVDEIELLAKRFVPQRFSYEVELVKLTPDAPMIARAITEILNGRYKAVAAVLLQDDIEVEHVEHGFAYTLHLFRSAGIDKEIIDGVTAELKKQFCGEFFGKIELSSRTAEDIHIEEQHENIEYEVPLRTFEIADFDFIEGKEVQTRAFYLADVNFQSENVVICGRIDRIEERSYIQKSTGNERTYLAILLNDTTGSLRVTYFYRKATEEKIKKLAEGDYIVCTGKTDVFRGEVRYTANYIDKGRMPEGFVPEKRKSKPVPQYYTTVFPADYVDFKQSDMFADSSLPACLKGKTFVVLDLETTGLNSSPSGGNMDRIIEIGAYRIIDGVIKDSFTTFINPEKKLSEEIVKLTGISDDMVVGAPTWQKAMPDFFKFCEGAVLVGHNIAGFDYKFVDYYWSQCGYFFDRNLMDTLMLSQELLFLSNYKLNTVADHFSIEFNHHRAIDDALATAKIFIELIKIKKSLPKTV